MSITEDHPAFRVAVARRILAREGCESRVAGHVSVRAPDRADAMWVSPFGYFDQTVPSDLIKTTLDLERLEGDAEPSPAIAFHAALYKARPDAQSVIHTHSRWVEVLSTTAQDVGMYSADSCLFYEEQAHYADDGIQPPVDGVRMAAALGAAKRAAHRQPRRGDRREVPRGGHRQGPGARDLGPSATSTPS